MAAKAVESNPVSPRPIDIGQELSDGVEPSDPEYHPVLENLQGNILRGHGRDHVLLLLWRVNRGREAEMKAALRNLVEKKVLWSARAQEDDHLDYVKHDASRPEKRAHREVFANAFLSKSGYEALGLDRIPDDPAFHRGMKGAGMRLNDPHSSTWDTFYREAIHGMILLAHDEPKVLERQHLEIRRDLEGVATVEIERGDVIRIGAGRDVVEHFGFADARSQPIFLRNELEFEVAPRGGIDRTRATGYDPRAPLSLVLARDARSSKPYAFGSYLVYRKLRQDVPTFHRKVKELAEVLGWTDADAEKRVHALLAGRFQNGAPIVLQNNDKLQGAIPPNNFNYAGDPDGTKCPIHAHVRRMNERSKSYTERLRRIVRRGITFDYSKSRPRPERQGNGADDSGKGLLFMCFQADIGRQFEYLQQAANDPSNGLDPIVGQSKIGESIAPQRWPRTWGDAQAGSRFYDFSGCVTLRGGEYFFAPSLRFFWGLVDKPIPRWVPREVFDNHEELEMHSRG
jgi:deferrochelatase/peroxidase EfeB